MSSASYLPRVWMGSQISTKLLPSNIRPLTVHVKFTENCQAKCISCDYWKSRWDDVISTDRAIALLNEIDALGIRSLRLTGGEPLLRKDLFQILEKSNASNFKRIVMQTNGLLIKKLHQQINDSPISKIAVSIDGVKETNDQIRGIRGYFDLGIEGMKLLRNKEIVFSVTMNRLSVGQLKELAQIAGEVGAKFEFNILTKALFFFAGADLDAMWPERRDVGEIARFLRDTLKRPEYEVDYVTKYYNQESPAEPPCVLGFLQVFVLSNGDVLTGCYPLKPVGNVLQNSLGDVLGSEAYHRQAVAMVRRECPGCTCGIESSLAMKHAISGAFFELSRLTQAKNKRPVPVAAASDAAVPAK